MALSLHNSTNFMAEIKSGGQSHYLPPRSTKKVDVPDDVVLPAGVRKVVAAVPAQGVAVVHTPTPAPAPAPAPSPKNDKS